MSPRGLAPAGRFVLGITEMFIRAILASAIVAILATPISAQVSAERERARPHYRAGEEFLRIEAWAEAAKSFSQAITIDPQFEDAYYGLGRAQMALKQFAEAILSYTKCRDLYQAEGGRRFTNQQEARRYWQDRIMEVDDILRQYQQGSQPQQTARTTQRIRQLQDLRRQLQERVTRSQSVSLDGQVPAFVSLALGSAYFRSAKLADAEREYLAAIATDPKAGEAHSNLAVVYMETGRFADAERSIAAAEKAGFKVHPQLKQDIKDRKKGT
jgi:tetratricopeptide (TPR) repeat protein